MRYFSLFALFLLFSSLFLLSCEGGEKSKVTIQEDNIKTIVLVRHAEKGSDDPDDPSLLPEGAERAIRLANHFRDWGFDQIWSTSYKRCVHTVQPLADSSNQEVMIFTVDNLWEFAQQLKSSETESILICGHSNTNPQLINYLIEEERYEEIAASEYDGIYIVMLSNHSKPEVKILRY